MPGFRYWIAVFCLPMAVYEAVPVYSAPFRLDEHLQRLQASLDSAFAWQSAEWREWCELILQAIAQQDFADQQVASAKSPAVAGPEPRLSAPDPVQPSTLIYPMPLITASAELKAQGVSAISREDYRWLRWRHQTLALWPTCANEDIIGCCAADQSSGTAVCPKAPQHILW